MLSKRIVHNKTDEWHIEWQRVTTIGATKHNQRQRMTTSGTQLWYNEWQRMTKSDNERQGMTTSGTTSVNEWQRMTISAIFFFQIRGEPATKHLKENSLNFEEGLWRRPIQLRAETSTQEEILPVRSRNCRSSCSQIIIKIIVGKIFAVFTGKHLRWSPFLRKL